VKLKLQRGDDPEIAASAANCPEEIFIFTDADCQVFALGSHQVGGDHVVAAQPVLAHQPPDPPAQGKAANSGGRDDTARGGEAIFFGFAVERRPRGATLNERGLPAGVDLDGIHQREIDHQDAVGDGLARDAVATSANGDGKPELSGEANHLHKIGDAGRTDNRARLAVDHSVPHAPNALVFRIARGEELAAEPETQSFQLLIAEILGHSENVPQRFLKFV